MVSDLCFIVEFFDFTFDFYIPESGEVPPSSDEAGRANTRSFRRAVPVATAMRPGGDSDGARQADGALGVNP